MLEKLATLRLLQQVSQVYQSMNIENLSKMITFFEFSAVEKISVDAVKHNFLAMKVDHMKGVVAFGNSVTITPEVISKKLHQEIINKLVELYCESHLGKRQLAYDGRKSVYTAGPLPFSSKDFVIKLVDLDRGARKDREFKVSFKFAAKPDIHHLQEFMRGRQLDTSQETIQVLDVVFRATLSMK
ncbi:protein argonaute 1-like [Camellia sinensis]|uniref:protein argonaute 1-like n=1 Tax=Camellia sinensis TaxID=4442 RepID=UPI0010366027|nr:protein argonaute 1-like [Camellia sinensis]XP_028057943.1 protein argonaute 1-like [Camellia sinensis]XP_028057944.1 protein argonaute 1-like [Camellia sinensis]XP_028057945.1 protein argonaute 1-like [Camellia sinensis]